MKITDFSFSNSKLSVNALDFEFNKIGIYLLTGKNGCGKTSFINKLLFGNEKIEFATSEQQNCYDKKGKRNKLFSYVPQELRYDDVTIMDFLKKGGKNVDLKSAEEYFAFFQLNDLNLNSSMSLLSGEEKREISIILALLEKTPYLILDEPTNNLDDKSTLAIIKSIEKASLNRTVLVISNDPRLSFSDAINVNMDDDGLTEIGSISSLKSLNTNPCGDAKKGIFSFITRTLFNELNFLAQTIVACFFILTIVFVGLYFHRNYNTDDIDNMKRDSILVYNTEEVFGELNKVYTDGSGIKIDEKKKYKMIKYTDIPEIGTWSGVSNIYIFNPSYSTKINFAYWKKELLSKLYVISIPDIKRIQYSNQGWNSFRTDTAAKGRFPVDNKNEVMISKNQLIKFYGFSKEKAANSIGRTINVDGYNYKIVGLGYEDVCFVSYSQINSKYGYFNYNYSKSKYKEFVKRNQVFLKKEGSKDPSIVDAGIIIETKNGQEKTVLNKLFLTFPANNYNSLEYATTWIKTYNSAVFNKILIITSSISLVVGLLLSIINYFQLKNNVLKILEFENFMINRRVRVWYILAIILQYVVSFAICYSIATILDNITLFYSGIVIIGGLLIIIPSTITMALKIRHNNKVAPQNATET